MTPAAKQAREALEMCNDDEGRCAICGYRVCAVSCERAAALRALDAEGASTEARQDAAIRAEKKGGPRP